MGGRDRVHGAMPVMAKGQLLEALQVAHQLLPQERHLVAGYLQRDHFHHGADDLVVLIRRGRKVLGQVEEVPKESQRGILIQHVQ